MNNRTETPEAWGEHFTYHWLWGLYKVGPRTGVSIAEMVRPWQTDAAKITHLRHEIASFHQKSWPVRFFLRLFNIGDICKKLLIFCWLNDTQNSSSRQERHSTPFVASTADPNTGRSSMQINQTLFSASESNSEDTSSYDAPSVPEAEQQIPVRNIGMANDLELLGLTRTVGDFYTETEINIARKQMMLRWHPDKNPNDLKAAHSMTIQILSSYERVLKFTKQYYEELRNGINNGFAGFSDLDITDLFREKLISKYIQLVNIFQKHIKQYKEDCLGDEGFDNQLQHKEKYLSACREALEQYYDDCIQVHDTFYEQLFRNPEYDRQDKQYQMERMEKSMEEIYARNEIRAVNMIYKWLDIYEPIIDCWRKINEPEKMEKLDSFKPYPSMVQPPSPASAPKEEKQDIRPQLALKLPVAPSCLRLSSAVLFARGQRSVPKSSWMEPIPSDATMLSEKHVGFNSGEYLKIALIDVDASTLESTAHRALYNALLKGRKDLQSSSWNNWMARDEYLQKLRIHYREMIWWLTCLSAVKVSNMPEEKRVCAQNSGRVTVDNLILRLNTVLAEAEYGRGWRPKLPFYQKLCDVIKEYNAAKNPEKQEPKKSAFDFISYFAR